MTDICLLLHLLSITILNILTIISSVIINIPSAFLLT